MGIFSQKKKDAASDVIGSQLNVSSSKDGAEYTFELEGRLDTNTSPEFESKISSKFRCRKLIGVPKKPAFWGKDERRSDTVTVIPDRYQ